MQQKILSSKVLGAGRYLTLNELEFLDDRGRVRHWESVDRRGGTGAAFLIARIVPDDEILLVRQFRPPAGKRMLEFPAGLIEPGEEAAPAAPGAVSVTVDTIQAIPGALVSGSVVFSDGEKARWFFDQMGRFGFEPELPGYQPSAEDSRAFQTQLQTALSQRGY